MNRTVITAVVTAATSFDLTTLAVVKDELDVLDNSKNTSLQRYISSASAAVMQYCNRTLVVETVSDEFLPIRDRSYVIMSEKIVPLQLTRWPVVSVTSVTENGSDLDEDVDYLVDPDTAQLTRLDTSGEPCNWAAFIIKVVYSAGYNPIPLDVADAVVRMVTKRYAAKGRDSTLKQESIPGVLERQFWIATGAEAGNMTPDITDILDNYRVPTLA
jgi:hypothetical protein